MHILVETLLVITILLILALVMTLSGKEEEIHVSEADGNLYLDSEGNHAHYDKTSIRMKTQG